MLLAFILNRYGVQRSRRCRLDAIVQSPKALNACVRVRYTRARKKRAYMFMFVLCTTVFLLVWYMFFQPKQDAQLRVENVVNSQQEQAVVNNNQELSTNNKETISLP